MSARGRNTKSGDQRLAPPEYVFLDDMANFAEMNEQYKKLSIHEPASTLIVVKAPSEIECIALA
ncbi:hypothetical protein BJX61DRAFT_543098 [Aspergillus egyptiacus]|nr:hypothetical protein BJX61DRAFT_543098 [Aspergillus egyptiacus]